jgi:hypothetical protein
LPSLGGHGTDTFFRRGALTFEGVLIDTPNHASRWAVTGGSARFGGMHGVIATEQVAAGQDVVIRLAG